MANTPGALAGLAEELAQKGINIDCGYATAPKRAKKAVVMLATSKVGGVPVREESDEDEDNLVVKDGYAEGPVG